MSDEFSPHHTRTTCARWGRKGRPGRAALTFRDFVSVKSEVDQSAGADIVEVVGGKCVRARGISREVAILNPYRHRSSVDFLDNTETPDLDIRLAGKSCQRISDVNQTRRVIILSSQVLAVEDRVPKR